MKSHLGLTIDRAAVVGGNGSITDFHAGSDHLVRGEMPKGGGVSRAHRHMPPLSEGRAKVLRSSGMVSLRHAPEDGNHHKQDDWKDGARASQGLLWRMPTGAFYLGH